MIIKFCLEYDTCRKTSQPKTGGKGHKLFTQNIVQIVTPKKLQLQWYSVKMTSECTIVSIDGNIGAGKSTVIKELERHGYVIFPEDIATLEPLLEGFYNDPYRCSFMIQIGILNSLNDQLVKIKYLKPFHTIIFMERAPDSNKLFADICHEKGYISETEYKVYIGCFKKLVWAQDIKLFINSNSNMIGKN